MKQKHQRLTFILLGLLCLGSAVGIILNNFQDNLVFFYSPTELKEKTIAYNKLIRIGGLVEEGTVKQSEDGQKHEFNITDLTNSVKVKYTGILPPMFREGQGMVATGKLEGDVFIANNLLTKHDENYMPPEVAKSLKKSGQWREEE
ncbi:MAG: cytochrome c maturation protein CcmE [Rickettsiales bacterium]|nr:cytochrome c maturation protein CcmE [Pseudomonadota bacterium]MDA0967386.1 cytochrome c maturation protein CcmE [Pseudomonadota bacterium]MDG4544409.1 cytochrome c maturation protein CcmE [Rickettsiales bacterium]MDG4546539.1 cytochrome c maturation protein CcmE [Rickettsiales bacterium]MDG4548685.1 cytochrome c maturation protein CcmE [Rickettsiales bacterium]